MTLRGTYKQLLSIERVCCAYCAKDDPPNVRLAVCMAPVRKNPYAFNADGLTINKSLELVCEQCKVKLNDWQLKNIVTPVCFWDKRLVHTYGNQG